jgi:hypothetical protein
MPVVNVDQPIDLKKRAKEYWALAPQDLVEMAMEIRQRGGDNVDRWKTALVDGDMAGSVREEAGEERRDGSWVKWVRWVRWVRWVKWMVGKLRLALQKGEQLEGQREGWGRVGNDVDRARVVRRQGKRSVRGPRGAEVQCG